MDYTGHKINKYQVIRLIGEGGMASVYEAKHEILGTRVAIKILNPILSANKQIRERFLNEAKMMASFQHPNITNIIDFEDNKEFLAIILEFLEGQDLSDRIKLGKKMSEIEIVQIFEQILSAFQYAHEKGIVHRDIKPSNIFILPNGHVKVLDFGIAKLFGQGNEMTQTGTQMGTPVYMSPEQVRGEKSIDHRSDIYSLGVTLFYAVNGSPPYDTATGSQFDIFNKIVYEPLPTLNSESKLVSLITKACQKDRDQRFQSCTEFLAILKSLQIGSPNVQKLEGSEDKISSNDKTIVETSSVPKDQQENNKPSNSFTLNSTQGNSSNPKNKKALIVLLMILLIGGGIAVGVYIGNDNSSTSTGTADAVAPTASAEADASATAEAVIEEPINAVAEASAEAAYAPESEFWCEGDQKFIPMAWVNDGACDCPTNCEDE